MRNLHIVAFLLVIVGAINWGLMGLSDINLVNIVFGSMPSLERFVYILVGASGVYIGLTHVRDCRTCSPKKK